MRIMISPTSPSSCPLLIGLSTAILPCNRKEVSLQLHHAKKYHYRSMLPAYHIPCHPWNIQTLRQVQRHPNITLQRLTIRHQPQKLHSRSGRFTFSKHWSDSPRQATRQCWIARIPHGLSHSSRHQGPTSILLFGDSHASMWGDCIKQICLENDYTANAFCG